MIDLNADNQTATINGHQQKYNDVVVHDIDEAYQNLQDQKAKQKAKETEQMWQDLGHRHPIEQ